MRKYENIYVNNKILVMRVKEELIAKRKPIT